MLFGFQQSIEVNSKNEKSYGTITLKNMDFVLVAEPVLKQYECGFKYIKVNIKSHSLKIGEYDVEIKSEPDKKSQFQEIKEAKSSTEYMYEQVIHYELPEQLAETIKKGSENAFAHIQNTTWHLLAEHSDKIHVDSSILNLCYI